MYKPSLKLLSVLHSVGLVAVFLAWLVCIIQTDKLVANAQENTDSQGQPVGTSYIIVWCNLGTTPLRTALRYLDKRTNQYSSWKHSETVRTLQPNECREVSIDSRRIYDAGPNSQVYVDRAGEWIFEKFWLSKDKKCYTVNMRWSRPFQRSSCNDIVSLPVKFRDE